MAPDPVKLTPEERLHKLTQVMRSLGEVRGDPRTSRLIAELEALIEERDTLEGGS